MKAKEYDIAVIGGGPAGLIAAGRAAEMGARVVVLEKNEKLGRKLLLTGKGRCNVTNAEFNLKKLVGYYGPKGKFLFRAFSLFGPAKVVKFFLDLGVETKVERGNRVFPVSDNSLDILQALRRYLQKNKVEILTDTAVNEIIVRDGRIEKLVVKGSDIVAKQYILATGGQSYPQIGSTGDGFKWAQQMGHRVTELKPALVPLKVKEDWVKDLQGLSLKNVTINGEMGECLFTHFGLSGPIILNISQDIKTPATLTLDLKPALDFEKLNERIERDWNESKNKAFRNSLNDLLPSKMIPVMVKLSEINPEKKVHSITREERHRLVRLMKNMEMTAVGLMGFDMAIVTKGGVDLLEIDDKKMQSKIISNLFFAGEVIDINGPTGGFNLQLCWSTGRLAGESAQVAI